MNRRLFKNQADSTMFMLHEFFRKEKPEEGVPVIPDTDNPHEVDKFVNRVMTAIK
jgi:hypothetical protein